MYYSLNLNLNLFTNLNLTLSLILAKIMKLLIQSAIGFANIYGMFLFIELTKINIILPILFVYSKEHFFMYCVLVFVLFEYTCNYSGHECDHLYDEKQVLIDVLFSYQTFMLSIFTTSIYMILFYLFQNV